MISKVVSGFMRGAFKGEEGIVKASDKIADSIFKNASEAVLKADIRAALPAKLELDYNACLGLKKFEKEIDSMAENAEKTQLLGKITAALSAIDEDLPCIVNKLKNLNLPISDILGKIKQTTFEIVEGRLFASTKEGVDYLAKLKSRNLYLDDLRNPGGRESFSGLVKGLNHPGSKRPAMDILAGNLSLTA